MLKAIVSDIDISVEDDDIREFMKINVLFYALLLFTAESEVDIKEVLFSKEFPFTFEQNFLIHSYIETQIKVFRDDYSLATTDQKSNVVGLTVQLFECIFSKLIDMFHQASFELQKNLLPPTCTISEVYQRRLLILSMFNNDRDIIHFIQSSTVPKNYAIRNTNKNKRLNPYIFKELQLYLPREVKFQPHSQLEDFEKYLWKTHLHKSPMMREKLAGVRLANIDASFTEAEILQQIFVFSLENWEDVWRLNMPCSIEIVKRLSFLKQTENWKPNAAELVKAMLMD